MILKKHLFQSARLTFPRLLLLIVFIGVLYSECFNIKFSSEYWVMMVMPSVILTFLLNYKNENQKFKILILIAFLFSWIGDIILLQTKDDLSVFYFGLLAFLFTHVFYILAFIWENKKQDLHSFLKRKPYWTLPYLFVFLVFIIFLPANLGSVTMVFIILYSISILTMSVMALNRLGRCNYLSFILVFIGTILFVISDCVIAINKFIIRIPFPGCIILGTYISAQIFILEGIIKNQKVYSIRH